jgi:hypothetical protein
VCNSTGICFDDRDQHRLRASKVVPTAKVLYVSAQPPPVPSGDVEVCVAALGTGYNLASTDAVQEGVAVDGKTVDGKVGR